MLPNAAAADLALRAYSSVAAAESVTEVNLPMLSPKLRMCVPKLLINSSSTLADAKAPSNF